MFNLKGVLLPLATSILGLVGLGESQLSSCPQPGFRYLPPRILPGFSLTKIAENLTHPRQIIVDRREQLVVSSLGEGLIGFKTTYDSNGCPSATNRKVLVPDNGLNFTHAVLFSSDYKTLYASTPDVALSWEYDSRLFEVRGEAKVLVKGMALKNPLAITRAMAIPRKYPNLLLVFRSSEGDNDVAASMVSTGRSMVKIFDLSKVPSGGYDYVKDGTTFAYGVRDSVDMIEDRYHNFWNVDNGADMITRYNQSIGMDNPADEINFLGEVCPGSGKTTSPNYGFPACHGVWNSSALANNTLDLQVGQSFTIYPDVLTDSECQTETVQPRLSIFPHSAPLGMRFYNPYHPHLGEEFVDSAFITYHGPTGHKIVNVPFNRGTVAAPSTTKQGTVDFVWTDQSINTANCKSEINTGPTAIECISPVGLAFDEGGRMYFTSDQTGEIFAVTKDS
ncbi:hypothetical protein Dda_2442 [Drechslerella dactyloides]|uniref:Pyrroloquinoline quinone-dependent pyranose dehydrogenase beta-propeller domain-containing protein n=1 Tax=Drechslerella dactyloides TaxID=74499 RepID=A0AAD6IZI3_DREDA|nr:hypothetical protein Dda_2442 [Drechslerella dactyloides]